MPNGVKLWGDPNATDTNPLLKTFTNDVKRRGHKKFAALFLATKEDKQTSGFYFAAGRV